MPFQVTRLESLKEKLSDTVFLFVCTWENTFTFEQSSTQFIHPQSESDVCDLPSSLLTNDAAGWKSNIHSTASHVSRIMAARVGAIKVTWTSRLGLSETCLVLPIKTISRALRRIEGARGRTEQRFVTCAYNPCSTTHHCAQVAKYEAGWSA